MNAIKEKFQSVLGTFGVVLYYILLLFIGVAPLVVLDKSLIFDIVSLFLIQMFPPLSIILWVWALIVVLMSPITTLSIIYIVLFAAIIAIPVIFSLVSSILRIFNR